MTWSHTRSRFVHLGERSQLGKLSDGVMREWVGSMTPEEREEFCNALFEILSQGGKMRTLDDLRSAASPRRRRCCAAISARTRRKRRSSPS